MPPTPCAHCGNNYMPHTNKEEEKLCNNCSLREKGRTKKMDNTDTIEILIKCPKEIQHEIEEICINQGVGFSKYLLDLHMAHMQTNYFVKNPENLQFLEENNDFNEKKREKTENNITNNFDLKQKVVDNENIAPKKKKFDKKVEN